MKTNDDDQVKIKIHVPGAVGDWKTIKRKKKTRIQKKCKSYIRKY